MIPCLTFAIAHHRCYPLKVQGRGNFVFLSRPWGPCSSLRSLLSGKLPHEAITAQWSLPTNGRSPKAQLQCTPTHTTPHYSAPHHTTLQYSTPHHTTILHTTPHHTTILHTPPHHTTMLHTTRHDTALYWCSWPAAEGAGRSLTGHSGRAQIYQLVLRLTDISAGLTSYRCISWSNILQMYQLVLRLTELSNISAGLTSYNWERDGVKLI